MPVKIQPLLGFAAFACQTVLLFLAAWLPATALAQDAGATEATVADSSEEAFEEVKIWPAGLPPGAVTFPQTRVEELLKKNATEKCLAYVQDPSLLVFQPEPKNATGCAVIVCPGGGYNRCCIKHEGIEVAEWFRSIGVTAFVLKYRVPRRTEKIHWEPMQDLQRSIRMVRHNAEKWKIDPQRLGVLGFSAGGHLTLMAGLNSDTQSYAPRDEVDKADRAPNFICPIYAAYMSNGYRDDKAELGDLIRVSSTSPPTFMAVTGDDRMRGAQSALLFARLCEHGVAAELHAYTSGGHGYGITATGKPVANWNLQLEAWLKNQHWLDKSK